MANEKHVVIVGAGFAGLQAVKTLANKKGFQVTLVDKTNHHLFQPLLYQVASSVLSPTDIAIPTRSLTTKYENVHVVLSALKGINKKEKKVILDHKSLSYDYLVLALGAQTSYFGNDHWGKYATGLKNLRDALKIRQKVLMSFEKAELSGDKDKVAELLNYVVIGGGPTGVEVAGAIAELSQNIIRKDFRLIDSAKSKVILIEAGPRLLPAFSEKSSKITLKEIEKRGVTVMLNTSVNEIDEQGVHIADRLIESSNIIWAAGVAANKITQQLDVELDKAGRVIVDSHCSIKDYPEIFALGDMACFIDSKNGNPLPGVSPVAMQQGRYVGKTILQEGKGKQRKKGFVYLDKGNMATIGRSDAVAEVGSFRMSGFIGWIAWLVVHLFYQVGFKNKVSILIGWVWNYIRFKAGARLIHEED
jgi:NADH:ubiquinone reductase (H+-translocating)